MSFRRFAVGIATGVALLSPSTALAQDGDQALMGGIAAFKNSEGVCYYSPEVAPIIEKMDEYLTTLYGVEWTEGLRQLRIRLTPMVNAWKLGGVPECSFYGQTVARGLQLAPIIFGLSADTEVARLTSEGGRRLADAPAEDVPAPRNEMAEFMEQYHENAAAGDTDLLSVDDAQGTYTIAARDIEREGKQVSMTLLAKGARIDHRQVRLDCAAGTVQTWNEFDVSGSGGTVGDIKAEMEEAQEIALEIFCRP